MKYIAALRLISVSICLSVLASCSNGRGDSDPNPDCYCSLVQLIATPDLYDGKKVNVMGIAFGLDHQRDSGLLFLTREDGLVLNTANSVLIDDTSSENSKTKDFSQFDGKHILIEGVFTYKDDLRQINDIWRLEILPRVDSN